MIALPTFFKSVEKYFQHNEISVAHSSWTFPQRTLMILPCKSRKTNGNFKWTWWMNVISEYSWWRHQMETFSALLAICAVTGEFPAQRPVTRSFDDFFDLHPNKRLSKQSWGWWFEQPSRSLWRHCNVEFKLSVNCRGISCIATSPTVSFASHLPGGRFKNA